MYTKLIKFVVLLSLVLLSGFAGRVLYSPLLNRASQGRDPRHRDLIRTSLCLLCPLTTDKTHLLVENRRRVQKAMLC